MKEDYKEQNSLFLEQKLYRFENGYGASVIRGRHSYGGRRGLWELAVLVFSEDNFYLESWRLCYTTPITDSVMGYLSEAEVATYLEQIKNLPTVAPFEKEGRNDCN